MRAFDRMVLHVWTEPTWSRVNGEVSLVLFHQRYVDGVGETRVLRPVRDETLERVSEQEHVEPSFRLDGAGAQRLMDGLWDAGVRPTAGAGSAGQMAAVEAHLEDMRLIASGALNRALGGGCIALPSKGRGS
jgi:hypothetical protein